MNWPWESHGIQEDLTMRYLVVYQEILITRCQNRGVKKKIFELTMRYLMVYQENLTMRYLVVYQKILITRPRDAKTRGCKNKFLNWPWDISWCTKRFSSRDHEMPKQGGVKINFWIDHEISRGVQRESHHETMRRRERGGVSIFLPSKFSHFAVKSLYFL